MDTTRTTESLFIGGPFAGRIAPNGQAVYRSAETGKALPTAYGDRWLIGHQGEQDNPKVAEKLQGIYARQSSRTYWTAYVWAPTLDSWLAAGRPDDWSEAVIQTQRRRSTTAA